MYRDQPGSFAARATAPVWLATLMAIRFAASGAAQEVAPSSNDKTTTFSIATTRALAANGSRNVGDVVDTLVARIGTREVKAYRVIAKIEGADTTFIGVVDKTSDLKDEELTIQTSCLRDFFLERVGKPAVISYGCLGGWGSNAGLRSDAGIKDYMGGFRTAGTASLTLGDQQAGLYSELASDNLFLSARAGFARIGFGALVSAEDEDVSETSEKTTASQFYQGGGNASIYLAFPAFYWRNFIQPLNRPAPQFIRRADLFLTLVTSADIPDMGASVENPATNVRAGFQGTFTQSTMGETFNLYLHLDGTAGWGSRAFFENLGVEDKKVFLVGQIGAGVDINRVLRIGMTTGASTMGANLKPRLSIKLIPN
jgi:hypothetical protein